MKNRLKLEVESQRRHNHRAAIAVVAGVVDILETRGRINAAPNVQGVVHLYDIFAAIVETAITQQKSRAAEREIFLMIPRNAVGNKGDAGAIQCSSPSPTVCRYPDLRGLVHFGVGVRFVPTFVPAPASERGEPVVERLLEICAEAILHRGAKRMGDDLRYGRQAGAK